MAAGILNQVILNNKNMKNRIIFVTVVLVVIFVVWFANKTIGIKVDLEGKVHRDLYAHASGVWDPQMQVLPFRPQDINGQQVGSSTQLRLEWQKPEKKYNHFVITITDPISGYTRKESGEHDRTSLDPDALTPATEYIFALQACLDRRCEKWMIAQNESRGTTASQIRSQDESTKILNP